MHVLDESTNIVANLQFVSIFHLASREDNFTMHSGKFLSFRNEASPGCHPTCHQFPNFRPTILAKVGCTTFFDITVLEILVVRD